MKKLRRIAGIVRFIYCEFFHKPERTQTARLALYALMTQVFNSVEIRVFFAILGFEMYLPDRDATQEYLAIEAVLLLERTGFVEEALDRLRAVRPRYRQEIERVRRLYREEGPRV